MRWMWLLPVVLLLTAAAPATTPTPLPPVAASTSGMEVHVLRLRPGDDVMLVLRGYVTQRGIQAAAILSAVGSLTRVNLRYAGRKDGTRLEGKHEVVALSGTLDAQGAHVHAAVSDENGRTVGGHLMDGNIVYTTLEVVLGVPHNLVFTREPDAQSGYHELVVRPAP